MAITATLIERTPYRLRYLCTSDGQATASPDSVVIPNAEGTTPDLRTDAGVENESPIDDLVSTAVATQAEARALLDGVGLTTVDDINVERGHLSVWPRNSLGDQHWGVDANEGAAAGDAPSAGFAVVVASGPNVASAAAIIEVKLVHSIDR